jgi:hypothetical protein
MKAGRDVETVITELARQREAARDFHAPTKLMRFAAPEGARPSIALEGIARFDVRPLAERQLAEWAGIPGRYYDRMATTARPLLEANVNHWLREQSAVRLVRLLDDEVRAFLSAMYRRLDNLDLANAVLPVLAGVEGVTIESIEVTETRFYVQAVTSHVTGEVRVGDVVQAGVIVRGSEVGHGAVAIEPLLHRLACKNGLVIADKRTRKMHAGARIDVDGIEEALLTDETKALTDAALWAQVRDLTAAALTEVHFAPALERLRGAAAAPVTADPVRVVEVTAKRIGLTEAERNLTLRHLFSDPAPARDGQLTQYDVANAVTRTAQDVDSYDRAYELEKAGGAIIELSRRDWTDINRAAA